jgi:putative transcriptional regulator
MAYGAGSLGEGPALVVAGHLAACPRCRDRVATLETVGGALLDTVEPMDMTEGALTALLARLDDLPEDAPPPPSPPQPAALDLDIMLPAPLRARLADPEADKTWLEVEPGVQQLVLHKPRHPGGPTTMLLRITPGRKMPRHGHRGLEMTLVLDGGYRDALGHFVAGDVAEVERGMDHQPITDSGRNCVCLVALDAPLEFWNPAPGPLQRLFG